MPAMRADRRGFTVAELLIVVAIIAVLVGVAIPVFNNQTERAREATDAANIRSAYAEVRTSFITDDRTLAASWDGAAEAWVKRVDLTQSANGWASEQLKSTLDSLCSSAQQTGAPVRNGFAKVLCLLNGTVQIVYSGNVIDTVTASDFLTKEKLEEMFEGGGSKYSYSVINSNETYAQGGGTKKFEDFAKKYGLDLANYGATTWQMYVKEADKSDKFLDQPAIYWSTVDINNLPEGTGVPVMGYRDGHYDVWFAKVTIYNKGNTTEYHSFENSTASVKDSGGSASFQFDSYEKARAEYDKMYQLYSNRGSLVKDDLTSAGL